MKNAMNVDWLWWGLQACGFILVKVTWIFQVYREEKFYTFFVIYSLNTSNRFSVYLCASQYTSIFFSSSTEVYLIK